MCSENIILRCFALNQRALFISLHLSFEYCPAGQWYPVTVATLPFCGLVTQPCPTLCDSMGYSLPGSSAHGILQARILEWGAILFSKAFAWPKDQTWVSCIAGRFFTIWAIREVPTLPNQMLKMFCDWGQRWGEWLSLHILWFSLKPKQHCWVTPASKWNS